MKLHTEDLIIFNHYQIALRPPYQAHCNGQDNASKMRHSYKT